LGQHIGQFTERVLFADRTMLQCCVRLSSVCFLWRNDVMYCGVCVLEQKLLLTG